MKEEKVEKAARGFAAMDPEKQRAVASKGGKLAHVKGKAHEFTSEEAAEAGRRGGVEVARDVEHMREIGRKGGTKVSRDRAHMARLGAKGGEKVAQDREHMRAIGRKGGAANKAKGLKLRKSIDESSRRSIETVLGTLPSEATRRFLEWFKIGSLQDLPAARLESALDRLIVLEIEYTRGLSATGKDATWE